MAKRLFLLYLDRYNQEDLLFMQSLAREAGRLGPQAPPVVLVHGSGEYAERMLEAEGVFVEREAGVLTPGAPEERALIERAIREMNRRFVGQLTDEVVSAVGLQGTDRRLLQRKPDGTLTAPGAETLRQLAAQRVVPVVSTLVRDASSGMPQEAAPAEVLAVLARALQPNTTVVCFPRAPHAGVQVDGEIAERLRLEEHPGALETLPEPEVARSALRAGVPLLVTQPAGFFASGGPAGTWIEA